MNHLESVLSSKNQWWKYLIMFAGVYLSTITIGIIPFVVIFTIKSIQSPEIMDVPVSDNVMDLSIYGIDPNLGLLLIIIIPTVVGLIALALLLKLMHKRKLKKLVNGTNIIRWEKFFTATALWTLLMGLFLVINYFLVPGNFVINFDMTLLFPLLITSILFLPLQTTFEELMFRGYLAQGVGFWTKSRWFALIIPALLFSLIHILNPEVKEYGFWMVMPQYLTFGLVYGLIAILDDGIEVSMGAHAANNIFGSVFVTFKASVLQTNALLEEQIVNPVKDLLILLAISIIFVVILKRKYKWDFSVLNKKIEPEMSQIVNKIIPD